MKSDFPFLFGTSGFTQKVVGSLAGFRAETAPVTLGGDH